MTKLLAIPFYLQNVFLNNSVNEECNEMTPGFYIRPRFLKDGINLFTTYVSQRHVYCTQNISY